jgi:hypothetical protein
MSVMSADANIRVRRRDRPGGLLTGIRRSPEVKSFFGTHSQTQPEHDPAQASAPGADGRPDQVTA